MFLTAKELDNTQNVRFEGLSWIEDHSKIENFDTTTTERMCNSFISTALKALSTPQNKQKLLSTNDAIDIALNIEPIIVTPGGPEGVWKVLSGGTRTAVLTHMSRKIYDALFAYIVEVDKNDRTGINNNLHVKNRINLGLHAIRKDISKEDMATSNEIRTSMPFLAKVANASKMDGKIKYRAVKVGLTKEDLEMGLNLLNYNDTIKSYIYKGVISRRHHLSFMSKHYEVLTLEPWSKLIEERCKSAELNYDEFEIPSFDIRLGSKALELLHSDKDEFARYFAYSECILIDNEMEAAFLPDSDRLKSDTTNYLNKLAERLRELYPMSLDYVKDGMHNNRYQWNRSEWVETDGLHNKNCIVVFIRSYEVKFYERVVEKRKEIEDKVFDRAEKRIASYSDKINKELLINMFDIDDIEIEDKNSVNSVLLDLIYSQISGRVPNNEFSYDKSSRFMFARSSKDAALYVVRNIPRLLDYNMNICFSIFKSIYGDNEITKNQIHNVRSAYINHVSEFKEKVMSRAEKNSKDKITKHDKSFKIAVGKVFIDKNKLYDVEDLFVSMNYPQGHSEYIHKLAKKVAKDLSITKVNSYSMKRLIELINGTIDFLDSRAEDRVFYADYFTDEVVNSSNAFDFILKCRAEFNYNESNATSYFKNPDNFNSLIELLDMEFQFIVKVDRSEVSKAIRKVDNIVDLEASIAGLAYNLNAAIDLANKQ